MKEGLRMKEKSIRKNFFMNALLALSGVVFPLISFRYASRILLPEGIGKVQFATSVIAYFSMFAQLGIPTYGIRACAKVRDDREQLTKTVHELLGINLVMVLVSYLFLASTLFLVPRLREEKLLFGIISSTILLNSVGMEWLYKGLEEYTYITVRSLIFKAIALVMLLVLIRSESDYALYGGISIFASSASNLLNLFHAGKHIRFIRPRGCDWRHHLKPVLIFFGMTCAATIYTNLDSVMLGFMTTDADVGLYNAAIKIKTVLVTMITSLGTVLLPRSAYYLEQGKREDFRRITWKALRFVLLAAPPLSLFFFLFAKESILILSGEAFLSSAISMRILIPTVLLIGLTNLLGIQILVPLGKEQVVLKSEIMGAIADLILNLLLIPRFRAAGAATGTLVAEMIVLAVQSHELRRELRSFFSDYRWKRLAAGAVIATTASVWTKAFNWRPVLVLSVSGGLFFLSYCCFMLRSREELILEVLERAERSFESFRAGRKGNRLVADDKDRE